MGEALCGSRMSESGSHVICLVDDDASVRKALTRLIRSFGYEVMPFASAGEMLSALETVEPACAILDHHVPGMTGLELHERLIRMGFQFPVIYITAFDDAAAADRAASLGAFAQLRKPFSGRAIVDRIQRAIDSTRSS
jgi:FixJ family two-component response regulator